MAQKKVQTPQSAPSSSPPSFPIEKLGICGGLLLLILVVFYQAASFGFIEFDDPGYVTKNFIVTAGFSSASLEYAFTSFEMGSWHPLTWLSHMADVQMYDLDPRGPHVTNIFFHCVNTILLFLLANRLTGTVWRSAILAVFFAIHPMHVEPVVWVASRKDMLSTFFLLLALFAWHRYTQQDASADRKQKAKWYGATFLLFALALMSKPNVVVFPFLLLLLDFWPLARFRTLSWKHLAIEKLPMLIPTIGVGIATYYGQKTAGALNALADLPFSTRLMNAIYSYGLYLLKSFWPYGLAPHYPYPEPMPVALVGLSLLVLIAISVWAVLVRERFPYVLMGWFWFLGATVPMLGLIQTGLQAYADRYVFISQIGLFIAVIWLVHDWLGAEQAASSTTRAALAVLILITAWRSYVQTGYWQNSYALFQHAVAVTERNGPAHMVLGISYIKDQHPVEGLAEIQEAIKYMPKHSPLYRSMAEALYMQKRYDEALVAVDKSIQMDPGIGQPYQAKGLILRALNRGPEAYQAFQKGLELGLPAETMPNTYLEMGQILMKERRFDDAVKLFQAALKITPYFYLAQKNLAFAYMNGQRWTEAEREFTMLFRINDKDPDVIQSLRFLNNRVGRK